MKGLSRLFALIALVSAVFPSFAVAGDRDLPVTLTGQGAVFGQATAVAVAIDIHPARCPNPLDMGSTGLLSVAILGTDSFHAVDVDVRSVRLEGAAPVSGSIADVATFMGVNASPCDCIAEGADGYRDLLLEFEIQDIAATLGAAAQNDTFVLTLTGVLRGRPGGDVIQGSDCVVVVGIPDPSVVPADVSVSPSSISVEALDHPRYRQIRCDITRVEGYELREIRGDTVRLNGEVAPARSQFRGNSSLLLWFQTSDLLDWLQPGPVELILTGRLANGRRFEGTGTMWIEASE